MAHNKYRGHAITFINGVCIYADTEQPVHTDPLRACGHCGKAQTQKGHDPCLADLPGVSNACCGHGQQNESYIQFENGTTVRGFVIDKD